MIFGDKKMTNPNLNLFLNNIIVLSYIRAKKNELIFFLI